MDGAGEMAQMWRASREVSKRLLRPRRDMDKLIADAG